VQQSRNEKEAKEYFEKALTRFKTLCRYEGLHEFWQKKGYEKPSIKKHRKEQKKNKERRHEC
jgi:ribosomal protein S21